MIRVESVDEPRPGRIVLVVDLDVGRRRRRAERQMPPRRGVLCQIRRDQADVRFARPRALTRKREAIVIAAHLQAAIVRSRRHADD